MRISDIELPTMLLLLLSTTVVLTILVSAGTSAASFGAYNSAWDGSSRLAAQAEAVDAEYLIGNSASDYENVQPSRTVAVVLSPEEPYTSAEAAQIRQFVRSGGTLVIAGDFDTNSNELLAAVGSNARLDSGVLRDDRNNYRSPYVVVATNVTNDALTQNVDEITLNYATHVRPNGATVLVRTSDFAYVDQNLNEAFDEDETLDSYPVVTAERIGEGQVIVISDPSLMINTMLERPGNQALVQSIFAGHQQVLFDRSHAAEAPLLTELTLTIRESPMIQLLTGFAGIGIIAISPIVVMKVKTLMQSRRRADPVFLAGSSRDELLSQLMSRHPDWDEGRVKRLVDAVYDPDDGSDSS